MICIIPARQGSKRIKNKNILKFFKKPIIGYTIKAEIKSKLFEKIIVSTDSKKISKIAKKYGAECPHLREKKLANDMTSTDKVIYNEINILKSEKVKFHCCIYPANPLLNSKTLKKAFNYFRYNRFNSLISVSDFDYPVLRALRINKKKISFKWKKYKSKRSQEIEHFVHDAGSFYFFNTEKFLMSKSIIMNNTGFYKLNRYDNVDIDTKEDLKFAKYLFRFKNEKNS